MHPQVIWDALHNLKNVRNTHGGVLLWVKLQAETWTPLPVSKGFPCSIPLMMSLCMNYSEKKGFAIFQKFQLLQNAWIFKSKKKFLLFSFEIIPIVSLSFIHYLSFLDFILCKFVTQLWSFLSSFSRGFAHETILVYTNVIGTMFFKDLLKPYLKIVLNHCYEYKNSITLPPVLPWIFCYVICYKHDNFGWERVPLR